MKVFLSYGSAGDQVTALRLQALAAVNGLTAYVPPAYTRDSKAGVLDGDTASRIGDADVVLGVIATDEICMPELVSLALDVMATGKSGEDAIAAMAKAVGLQRLRATSRPRLESAIRRAQRKLRM